MLPFFNAETTLKDAVNAVLAQTRADWELLLIDDGATDGSVQIANTYAAQDPRIRVLRQKNGGVGAARNAGLLAAKGDYIGFLDADDTIDPTFVQTLLCAAATNQAEVVHAAYREITIKGETLLRSTTDVQGGPQWVSPKKMRALVCNIEDNHYFWSVCRCVFRVDFLRRLGLRFHEDMHYGEDTVFLLEACLEAARVWDIPDALYVYRKNAGSSTTTFWARPDALASFALQDKAKRALFAKYLSKEENEAAARRYSRYCLRVYLPLLLQGTRRRLGKCDYRAERAILASAPAQRALRTCKPKELLEKSADSWVCCLAKFHCYFLAHLILKYIWPR
ncbi:MAG: glycosyltransferase [Oscillospiraceae bacterium]|nr:glycosyltransferase [Oscillospiraceae bacterium]